MPAGLATPRGYTDPWVSILTMPTPEPISAALTQMFTPRCSRTAFRPPTEGFEVCFNERFRRWHALCKKKPIMLKIELHNHDDRVEPAPKFATDAEISLAEQLRHQLEERYFGPAATSSRAPSGEVH